MGALSSEQASSEVSVTETVPSSRLSALTDQPGIDRKPAPVKTKVVAVRSKANLPLQKIRAAELPREEQRDSRKAAWLLAIVALLALVLAAGMISWGVLSSLASRSLAPHRRPMKTKPPSAARPSALPETSSSSSSALRLHTNTTQTVAPSTTLDPPSGSTRPAAIGGDTSTSSASTHAAQDPHHHHHHHHSPSTQTAKHQHHRRRTRTSLLAHNTSRSSAYSTVSFRRRRPRQSVTPSSIHNVRQRTSTSVIIQLVDNRAHSRRRGR